MPNDLLPGTKKIPSNSLHNKKNCSNLIAVKTLFFNLFKMLQP